MPTKKLQSFSFGGVDSRSNPANYPVNRSLRCLNFAPQESGALRLRSGYSVPMQATNDSVGATAIHSLIYYEQFSANYLGPQFCLYGKGSSIEQFNLTSGVSTLVGSMVTTNPWGHFRNNNYIYMSDGAAGFANLGLNADIQSWDGATLRAAGLPSPLNVPVPAASVSAYAGTASTLANTNGTAAWLNIGNITGPPDGNYATASPGPGSTLSRQTQWIVATNYNLSISAAAAIMAIDPTVTIEVVRLGESLLPFFIQLVYQGNLVGNPQTINVSANVGPQTLALSGINWGFGLTPAIVNDPSFGVAIAADGPSTGAAAAWSLDSIEVAALINAYAGIGVSVTADTVGSVAPTVLTGYQMFAAIYDPVTQHMGNRLAIGTPFTVGATASAIVITGIPSLGSVDPEWVTALGITNDGGQVPYWLVDPQGNNIVIGNTATSATVLFYLVNTLQELPYRNDPPQPMDKFARVGTRIFGHLSGNPYLQYSNDAADVSNADFVGDPVQSWPPDQQEPLPTGEMPTSIHGYRLEGWFFSRNNLCIWSNFLLQQGVNPWRGPYPGGCCGQRAFVETPYGPFWVSGELQLCTFMEDGVISVSDEYEAALLSQISTASLNLVEIAYLRDPASLTDQIVIKGFDSNANPVFITHDFKLIDERSAHGQGYLYQYSGLTVNTFAGAGFTPRQNVYDTNGKMRLWAGAQQGFIAQLEDGSTSDNGTTYTGDYIFLINCGPNKPVLAELEWQGDPNVAFSWTADFSQGLANFVPSDTEVINDAGEAVRYAAKMSGEAKYVYGRIQLVSHPADGNFALTDPPFVPMPSYGILTTATFKIGAERKEAR